MNQLSAREQRLVAVGILVALLAVVWFGAISPVLNGFSERRQARADADDTLRRNTRWIAGFGQLRGEMTLARQQATQWAVVAASPPQGAEAARAQIAKVVADSGGVLEALRDQTGGAGVIREQADIRIDALGLRKVLSRLEQNPPYAAVNALTVTAPDASSPQPLILQARLDVSYSYVASH